MKVVIISDSHGHIENAKKIMDLTTDIDMVICLGDILGQEERLKSMCDCPVKIVRGNCDYNSELPFFDVIELEKNRIFATHGHKFGVDFSLDRLMYAAEENKCNIALFGHTHVPEITMNSGIYIANPGSVTSPRQFNHKKSYILMETDKKGVPTFKINYI